MSSQIDRRQVVLASLAAGAAPGMAQAATDPLSGAALYADVKTYAGLGEHRTGTAGDNATTAWLERALKAAGYAVERQGFDYPVFDLVRSDVTVGGRTIDGFPYWTPGTTPAAGVSGPLSLTGGPGTVMLVDLPLGAGAGLDAPPPKLISEAVATKPAAVVAVTESALGLMAALNRNPKAPPWPMPVLLAAGAGAAALKAAAAAGQTATVRLVGTTTVRKAENVIGRRARSGKHLVVSTPKSGWLHCAGERGSGVAIWLGLARWLAANSDHNITVVAAAGHEFDGYGGDQFTGRLAPKPADTKLWVAIGANVAVYDFALRDGAIVRQAGPPAARTLACSGSLLSAAAKAFAGQRGYEKPIDLDIQSAPGEVAHFRALGYRPLVGMVAASNLHHTRRDLADVTDGTMLEPVARGLAGILREA